MPIETTDTGTMITDEDVPVYFLMSLVGRLAMQARGTKFRGMSPMMQAKAYCGSPKRTTNGVMEDYIVWMYQNGLELGALWGTVERMLGADRTAKLRRKAERAKPSRG